MDKKLSDEQLFLATFYWLQEETLMWMAQHQSGPSTETF